ncbi:MerR family transcriptional regulator [Mycobacteroides abscessus]|uniref:MerR family transcriptional regulator n=1 Tax=Mycobacteroides abscessus TaxID=36809 RepID=UPI000C2560E1|nr:MerR family transcriptional regulator [Mycobacteroides abscessus]
MSAVHYLSMTEFAEAVGLSVNTIKAYQRKGMLPDHDVEVGRNRGWKESTVLRWQAKRCGNAATTEFDAPAAWDIRIAIFRNGRKFGTLTGLDGRWDSLVNTLTRALDGRQIHKLPGLDPSQDTAIHADPASCANP